MRVKGWILFAGMIGISVAVIFSVCTMGTTDEEVELPM